MDNKAASTHAGKRSWDGERDSWRDERGKRGGGRRRPVLLTDQTKTGISSGESEQRENESRRSSKEQVRVGGMHRGTRGRQSGVSAKQQHGEPWAGLCVEVRWLAPLFAWLHYMPGWRAAGARSVLLEALHDKAAHKQRGGHGAGTESQRVAAGSRGRWSTVISRAKRCTTASRMLQTCCTRQQPHKVAAHRCSSLQPSSSGHAIMQVETRQLSIPALHKHCIASMLAV